MKLFEKKNTNTSVISIDNDDLQDAKLSSVDFKDESVKKRAFVNVLGARLAMKMLFSQKIEANNLYSLYTIQNLIEELDLADIYFNGIKMDVRVVFNRAELFVPKSHFKMDLLPDLYLVMELKKDFTSVEFLGFFEPKDLDTENQNKDFYFYDFGKLQDPKGIKKFLENFTPEHNFEMAQEDIEKSQEKFLPLADKTISSKDKQFLFKQLANNINLREKIVEFENFEMISRKIIKDGTLMQDSVLDIVGAQQLYDEEDDSKQEVKAEVHEEVLSDLLDDEITPSKPYELTDEDDEHIQNKNEKTNPTGGIITGLAVGGAIAAGAATAAAASTAAAAGSATLDSQADLIKGSAEALAAGADIASTLVEKGVDILSSGKDTGSDLIENLENTDNVNDEIDFDAIEDLLNDDENISDFSIEESKDEPETLDMDEFTTEIENENTDLIEEQPNETLEMIEPQEELEVLDVEEPTTEIEDENPEVEEQMTTLEINSESSSPSNNNEEVLEFDDIKNDILDDEFFELPELGTFTEMGDMLESQPLSESSNEDESFAANEEKNENVLSLDEFDFNALNVENQEKENNFDENAISFDAIIENQEEAEQNLRANVNEDSTNNEVFSFDAISDMTEEEIKLDDNSALQSEEFVTDSLGENSDSDVETNTLTNGSKQLLEDDLDETMQRLRELEGEEEIDNADEEVVTSINSETENNSDDIISQVDAFLSDVDFSDSDQKVLLETNLNEDLLKDNFDDIEKLAYSNEPVFVDEPTPAPQENIINNNTPETKDDAELLQVLFNNGQGNVIPELPEEEEQKVRPVSNKARDKKVLIAASALGIVLVGAVLSHGIITNQTQSPQNAAKTPMAADTASNNDPNTNNADMMANSTPTTPADATNTQPPENNQQAIASQDMSKSVSDAFSSEPVNASITKVAWEVPEDLAYNDSFRRYLQVAGKNLKLNLQNDLLLATEMAYSNRVIVDLKIGSDGSLQSENISVSSGSKQIDKIVLQSVKQTLQYLKMPSSELSGGSVNATLIINF